MLATFPLRLEEPELPANIRLAVEDMLETDEVRLDRLAAGGGTRLTEADMAEVRDRIVWLTAVLNGPKIDADGLKAWLRPKNLSCARPEVEQDFHWRTMGMAAMLGDLPAALFTLEALRSIRSKFLPCDEEIREALEPTVRRWKRELVGLRKLRPGPAPAEARARSAICPASVDEDVRRYEAMADGPTRRAGVRVLLTRIANRGTADILARYGERLRLLLESAATTPKERKAANDTCAIPSTAWRQNRSPRGSACLSPRRPRCAC
jgi:hypothetical protein